MFRDVVCLGEVHPVDLDVAADGSIWIAGYAYDGLQTMHALQPVCGGSTDLFFAHYASGTMRPLMVTCIGGRGGDGATVMALAPDGEPVVVGQTSSPDLPLVRPIQRTIGGVGGEFGYPSDAVIVRLDVTRRWLEYSTLVGGQHWDYPSDVAVGASGTAFVVGKTSSSDLPVTSGPSTLDVSDEASDAFLVSLDRLGRMRASVLLGGTGYDCAGPVVARPKHRSGPVDGQRLSEGAVEGREAAERVRERARCHLPEVPNPAYRPSDQPRATSEGGG